MTHRISSKRNLAVASAYGVASNFSSEQTPDNRTTHYISYSIPTCFSRSQVQLQQDFEVFLKHLQELPSGVEYFL